MTGKAMRRRYLVDRRYQVRTILEILALVVLATATSALATYLVASREIGSSFYLAHRDSWDIKELLFPVIAVTSAVTFVALSAVSALVVLRATHRVVGPQARLREALDALAHGRLVKVGALREGDVLKGLDISVNELAEGLEVLEADVSRVAAGLRRATEELGAGSLSEDQLRNLRGLVDDLEKALGFFHRP